jgi:hypothetical protein
MIRWLDEMVAAAREGLVEESRDIGWTWVAGGYAVHRWRFCPGFKTTFGSRIEDLVDQKGNPDSIFGKIRLLLDRLPHWMMPQGFNASEHDNHMRLLNPNNGNVISGEGGKNMGRGGRSTLYIVDEGAHIDQADKVDAAIIGNADTRIWASSANGSGNAFFRKRHSGNIPVFQFHWRDDPRKDEAWAEAKKKEVNPVVWASEYDIDYAASVDGICIPGEPSSKTRGDSESAARFYYCAKASKEDRDEGLEGLDSKKQDDSRKDGNPGGDNPRNRGLALRANHHPTVKPTDLMRYLCRLVTPRGGVVLDPFMGSGSTGKAAALEGFKFIGIEKEEEYFALACRRVEFGHKQPDMFHASTT